MNSIKLRYGGHFLKNNIFSVEEAVADAEAVRVSSVTIPPLEQIPTNVSIGTLHAQAFYVLYVRHGKNFNQH